jgi:hypothetical protein
VELLCHLLPRPLLYIVGRGCTLPLPQGSPREAAKGGGGRWWPRLVGPSHPQTLTLVGLGQGPRAPPIFLFLPHGLLSVNWPVR